MSEAGGVHAGLAARHPEVRYLRDLLRDRATRLDGNQCVAEGPRVISAALDRGAMIEAVYVADGATRAFSNLLDRLADAGVRLELLREGVLEKIGTTRSPQPLLGLIDLPAPVAVSDLQTDGCILVLCGVSDPGNFGTLLRSAEAAGAAGVVSCGGGVDPWNPKVVRASAGAIFGVPLVEDGDPLEVLEMLSSRGVRALGTIARGGEAPDALNLASGVALVLGNEAHGLPEEVADLLDGSVTIPMAGVSESLNVGVAGSILLFESARQRAAAV